MTKTVLQNGWTLHQIQPCELIVPGDFVDNPAGCDIETMPAQVHDVLYEAGLISDRYLLGWCEETLFVNDYDWVYQTKFTCDLNAHCYKLCFEGLDTLCDVYLNDRHVASHDDFYLMLDVDVTKLVCETNYLTLHFHNTRDYLQKQVMPSRWKDAVMHCKLLRKPIHDFPIGAEFGSNYQGAHPYFCPIGVYAPINLVALPECSFGELNLCADLQNSFDVGRVSLTASINGNPIGFRLRLSLFDSEDIKVKQIEQELFDEQAQVYVDVEKPRLWWPRGFGEQALYTVRIFILKDGEVKDWAERKVGFRHVAVPSDLEFVINGKRVRLFGGSLDPLQGYTHCYVPGRAERMFDMICNAEMNSLRIWGEGIPYPDAFYDEADRRGILIWQEFFLGHGAYPDNMQYRKKCLEEARQLILRLRHRASLLMWCGGNETIMGAEYAKVRPFGSVILLHDFPLLLRALDPGRYYHPNSPYGGEWANDPRVGDTHTYECVWEYPYQDYPNFMSEHIRTSAPVMHSLKQMIRGDVWPQGYDGKFRFDSRFPYPDTWAERSHVSAKGDLKTGPYWEYYDPTTPEELLYSFGASYAQEIRQGLEMIRTGSASGDVQPDKRSKGHFSCKLLDTWPKVYCAIIDYFQEAFHPYYATLRAQRPILLCFDRLSSIRLWLVNDSPNDIAGRVTLSIYHLSRECELYATSFDARMVQGESGIVFDLAKLHFFPRDSILYARFYDEDGFEVAHCIKWFAIERHMRFPASTAQVSISGDYLVVSAKRFLRCVEITGRSDDGNEFGWLFSDNYFDMMPGQKRLIKILGKIDMGVITVKPHYSAVGIQIKYVRAQ